MYEVVELERNTTWRDGSPVIIGRETCESLCEAAVLCVARTVEQAIVEYDRSRFEIWDDGSILDYRDFVPQDEEVFALLSEIGV